MNGYTTAAPLRRAGTGSTSSAARTSCCSARSCVCLCLPASWYSRPQDLDREDDVPLKQVAYDKLVDFHRSEAEAKKEREEIKSQILYEQKGFCKEGGEGDGY